MVHSPYAVRVGQLQMPVYFEYSQTPELSGPADSMRGDVVVVSGSRENVVANYKSYAEGLALLVFAAEQKMSRTKQEKGRERCETRWSLRPPFSDPQYTILLATYR